MQFSKLNISKPLLNGLNDMGLHSATPIQEKSFPIIMSGKDAVGIAQTGTGKTIAYLLPILRQVTFSKERHPRVLILVPTRELVQQVVMVAETLSKYQSIRVFGIYGESNINKQKQRVYEGLDILVTTPGRLIDLMLSRSVVLNSVKKLVIDEVDEMFNLGFRTQLLQILDALPKKRQNISFSATLSEETENMVHSYFVNPEFIETVSRGTPLQKIRQKAVPLPNQNTKVNYIRYLLDFAPEVQKILLFVKNKTVANMLEESLKDQQGKIGFVHSNKSQSSRFKSVELFDSGVYRMLVATDVIARGLDFRGVDLVINYDFPKEPSTYIHRIGRTGRAHQTGDALSLVTSKELNFLKAAEKLMNAEIELEVLPPEVEISDVLTEEELPKSRVKKLSKQKNATTGGGAFHEKKSKNKKVQLGGKRRQEKQRRAIELSRSKRKR